MIFCTYVTYCDYFFTTLLTVTTYLFIIAYPCVSRGDPPEISRRASWVVPETDVGSTKQMCSYSARVYILHTNFSYIWKSLPIPHDKVYLCGFAVFFLFPQMKSAFLGRDFFAVVLKRTVFVILTYSTAGFNYPLTYVTGINTGRLWIR